jgi:hypothetical protein
MTRRIHYIPAPPKANPEYTQPFRVSHRTGRLITNRFDEGCGCTWVYAPRTSPFGPSRPFVLKFPWSGCRHFREINR